MKNTHTLVNKATSTTIELPLIIGMSLGHKTIHESICEYYGLDIKRWNCLPKSSKTSTGSDPKAGASDFGKRTWKVDVPTESWQKSIERRLNKLELNN